MCCPPGGYVFKYSFLCCSPGGYVFNTEAHPIDTAALYCCSAEKNADDASINELHDNIDLLELLGLDDVDDLGNIEDDLDQIQNTRKRHKRKTKLRSPFSDNIFRTAGVPNILNDAETNAEEDDERILSEKPMDDNSQSSSEADISSTKSSPVFVYSSSTTDSCSPATETTLQPPIDAPLADEATESTVEQLTANWSYDSDQEYPARLFTCPSQPFHSRLSVYGEMFVDE